jgi:outer membrane lipoprotein SlyB
MKKVFLALAIMMAITVTSCKQVESTEATTVDTAQVDTTAKADTTKVDTVKVDTTKLADVHTAK